eukprot:scaffold22813_cov78-Cyclotella_meneghiniana.AAC.5
MDGSKKETTREIRGAFEWNRKGIYIRSLKNYIYPHFGVFPPTRHDYITLLDHIKTEVGIGTDINPYAIACSQDNFQRCALINKVHLINTDLFPTEQSLLYDVILFNPPWLPGDAMTQLDKAVYLMISNLGMLLGLFQEQNLHQMFDDGGLKVIEVYKTTSKEENNESTSKATKSNKMINSVEDARAKEVIFLCIIYV